MNAHELAQGLIELGIVDSSEIEGCSEEEIQRLEDFYGIHLPQAYREFLSVMGKKTGKFLAGTHIRYQSLFELKDWAIETLAEDGADLQLPDNAFVFYMHQASTFDYFLTSEGDDPPVYCYEEYDRQSSILYPKFSDFLKDCLGGYKRRHRG